MRLGGPRTLALIASVAAAVAALALVMLGVATCRPRAARRW